LQLSGKLQAIKGKLQDRFSDAYQAVIDWKPDVLCISQGGVYDVVDTPALRSLHRFLLRVPFPYVIICQAADDTYRVNDTLRGSARRLLAQARRVAFVARLNLSLTEQQLACKLAQGVVVGNPVNLRDISPVPWPELPASPAKLAIVARLESAAKGHDILFAALANLNQTVTDWHLNIYGQGPDEAYFRELLVHFGLTSQITFHGQASDIRALWAVNHLLVLPSRREGTPLALVEAMLCGRPALVTDVGGNADWITEPRTGFVAEAPSVSYVSRALARAFAVRDDWPQRGARAHDNAAALYDPRPGKTMLDLVISAAAKSGE
jgi:glycosyltransferase involved in cell wall biosynthesis